MIPPWNKSLPVAGSASGSPACASERSSSSVKLAPPFGRLVDAQRRRVRRRAAATVRGRRAVTGDRGADVDRVRVARVDRDRADRAVGRHRLAARHQRPRGAAVGRLEQAQTRLRVARPVRLARARVERVVIGVEDTATRTPSSAGPPAGRSTADATPARRPCARCRRRQPRPTARQFPASQAGSTAIAVTRPDSCVGGPSCVTGSKNCDASPETLGVIGPRPSQVPGATARALRYALPVLNAARGAVEGMRSKARRLLIARRSST